MVTTIGGGTRLAPAGQLDQVVIRGPAEPWPHSWQDRVDDGHNILRCGECERPYLGSVTSPCPDCGTPRPIGGT